MCDEDIIDELSQIKKVKNMNLKNGNINELNNQKSLLIIGAGQYGRLVKEIAEQIGYKKIDFLDDNSDLSIGKIKDLEYLQKNYTECICTIGNNKTRKEISERIENKATIISPNAIVFKSAKIGKGCVIEAGAVISSDAVVEDGCLICAGSVINHESKVNKYCQVDCNSVVKGIVPKMTKVEACSLWK